MLTASAEAGLIDQQEYFQKRIASHDLSHYYLLKSGDFAYNHSSSGSAALGIIKRLEAYDFGCLSTLYIIFHPKHGIDSDYLLHYFESSAWHGDVAGMVTEGARNHGLLNISPDTFFTARCSFPSLPEQRRIGKFFTIFDSLIAAAERQETLLRRKKQAYLQLMFPREGETEPRLRFAGYNGEWERRQFGELYVPSREKNDGSFSTKDIISVAGMRYASREPADSSDDYMKTYNVMRVGDIAFEGNRSGNFSHGRFVENDLGDGIVSHVFVVLRPLPGRRYDLAFWKEAIHDEFLMRRILARSTKRSTMMHEIVVPDFLKEIIRVPSLSEQQKIGEFFTTLDSAIDTSRKRVELLKKQKSAYLQSMFI